MKYALFSGCKSDFYLPQYRSSAKAVLSVLGVELTEPEFNCCGYPVRDKSFASSLLLAVRNLAIAEQQGLPILTLCKCCFGSLKHAQHHFMQDTEKQKMINNLLKEDGLCYEGTTEIRHLLTVLDQDIGHDAIKQQIKNKLRGLKIAPHYGCHALRPSSITDFASPHAPEIFERIIRLTGAEPVSWDLRLECCGNPLWDKNNKLSVQLVQQKMESASQAGADMICSACNHCQMQFDHGRNLAREQDCPDPVPSMVVSQLLGLAMGLPLKQLKIQNTQIGDKDGFDCQGFLADSIHERV